jgi:hypothetical protein
VIPADVHQWNEAALPAARNRKCACESVAGCPPRGRLPTSSLRPPTPRRATISMRQSRIITIHTDCVVRWHNPPLLESVGRPVVLRVRNGL